MAPNDNILLLEDDPNLGLIIRESLERQGYVVTLVPNGEEGLIKFDAGVFDLCLVDVMMPLRDGFSFAKEVRQRNQTIPLIFLTARSMTQDKLTGFHIGCDDYVTKPFSMEELLARIEAVMRRSRQEAPAEPQTIFQIGSYSFDFPRQQLGGFDETRRLTDKEAELLRLLCLFQDRTLERNYALRTIWGDEGYHTGRSMDVFISRLRKYLKDDSRIAIRAVHGQGFRLMVDA
jgi:DNA-binding response OmpR family regulator